MSELIEKISAIKGIGLLVLGLAAGIVLLVIGNKAESASEEQSAVKNEFSFEDYERSLSERLEEMIDRIDGASGVHVMLTLERGYSDELAKDGEEFLTVKQSDGAEGTVTLSREAPQVKGVAVICKGGDNHEIQKEIIELVSALLNIPTSRVFVSAG